MFIRKQNTKPKKFLKNFPEGHKTIYSINLVPIIVILYSDYQIKKTMHTRRPHTCDSASK